MRKHHTYIQQALDIRAQSAHETHKVGAVVVGDGYVSARANFYPEALESTIGHAQKLGNASTTVHAEIAAIIAAPEKTDGASIYITQRPCPNCAKAIIEAGITEIYICDQAKHTPLGQKINPFFESASLPFLTFAGVAVFEVGDEVIGLNTARYCHADGLGLQDFKGDFDALIKAQESTEPFAACIAQDQSGRAYFLRAEAQTPSCLPHERADAIAATQSKYETALQPINRLLMACAREGLRMDAAHIYSSQTPTSREFVNFLGAGYTSLHIGDTKLCRDEFGLLALEQLRAYQVIDVQK